jgi:DNA (cytosine-5)-methyltransferase 1
VTPIREQPSFYEFFAGGGMARAGLGPGWTCLFANDFDTKKGRAYAENWGARELIVGDVGRLSPVDLPGRADLVWGSFPCQDLSLAGAGAGLAGSRSGAFHPFWRLVEGLVAEGRAPKLIAIENVIGTLTSHGGRDIATICRRFAAAGYRWGALAVDTALFTPQSRPRLFVIGVRADLPIDPALLNSEPFDPFQPPALRRVCEGGLWWRLPEPLRRNVAFADLVEDAGWDPPAKTARLLSLMSPLNFAKVEAARRSGRRMVGSLYRRTRNGVQRAEVRFDDVAGCLRTPAGGSSRMTILLVDGERVVSRLISARETARLMGLDDSYRLPKAYNAAYHLTGDGVAVPVVRHLAAHLFEPLLGQGTAARAAA